MAMVTLIQKLETDARDAVVQVEDWLLPAEAKFTNTLDEAGRKVYTLFEVEVAKVKAEVPVVTAKVKKVAAAVKTDVANTVTAVETKADTVVNELKSELLDIEAKVEKVLKDL